MARADVDAEVQIGLDVFCKELPEPPVLQGALRVEIVVSGDEADVARLEVELAFEDGARACELGLEREVRDVARDDDVVDARARDLARERANVRGAVRVFFSEAGRDALGRRAPRTGELVERCAPEREVRARR